MANAAISSRETGSQQTVSAVVVFLGMIAVVGSALGFEHIGGYVPCALCLEQRVPYYLGIPFVGVGLLSALLKWPPCLTRGMLAIGFVCLCATAMLGVYHSGVEWGFFPGPASCVAGAGAESSVSTNLLEELQNSKPPSCDEAAGRFLGLSFAGWNVVGAVVLAVVAFRGAFGKAS